MKYQEMNKAQAIILFVVSLPVIIVGLLVFGLIYFFTTVIFAPIEVIIYKKSDFYREYGVKYFLGAIRNFGYKTYPYVKQNPNLSLVFQNEGYYYYKEEKENSILVLPYYEGFYLQEGEWYAKTGKENEGIKVASLKPVFEPLIKEDISSLDLRLLVTERMFKKDELERAKADSSFVFYKNHRDFSTITSRKRELFG